MIFPMTLYVAGQEKALQKYLGTIVVVIRTVILEVVYVLSMGGLMTICILDKQWT